MRPVVTVLDDYQGAALSSADWSAVAVTHDVDVVREHLGPEALIARLAATQVVVAMRERTAFPTELLRQLPSVQLLVTTGPRNAAIDLEGAKECGITVCGTRSTTASTVELTLALMLAVVRNVVAEDRSVRGGGWQHTVGRTLSGRTLGVVGLGRLGSQVAALGQAFGMAVQAWSPHLTQGRAALAGVRAVGHDELFSSSDVVTVHMALAASTRGLVGGRELRLMRPDSYLINTSRGAIVDETALVAALHERRIAGAGLDVYETEPLPADHPLLTAPNTVLLPHLGYVTTDNYQVFYGDAVDDIISFRDGAPLRVL